MQHFLFASTLCHLWEKIPARRSAGADSYGRRTRISPLKDRTIMRASPAPVVKDIGFPLVRLPGPPPLPGRAQTQDRARRRTGGRIPRRPRAGAGG